MTIWRPTAPVQQPDLTPPVIQPSFQIIEGEQVDIISSLRSFIFKKKETPAQWRNAAAILDKEEEKADIAAERPVLPPPAWD